jgi:hypothetical protein
LSLFIFKELKVDRGFSNQKKGRQFFYTFFDDYFNSLYHKEDQQGKAIVLYSIIAFIITCLGTGQILQATRNPVDALRYE